MTGSSAYIVAARRAANGRLGGLHGNRRIESLAAPVVAKALEDAGIAPARVDLLAVGNAMAGGNPARLIALVAGLDDRVSTLTVDRQAASGLEAILAALRTIYCGEADIVVAGGAEALSMAPWRIAKPRSLHHTPRFIGLGAGVDSEPGDVTGLEAANAFATRHGLGRSQQDEYALTSHIKAGLARDKRRFVREIVALKTKAEESRDELQGEPDIEELEDLPALHGDGTLTAGNTSQPADGAAFVLAVSERVYQELGRPPALVLRASAAIGVPPSAEMEAPVAAIRRLGQRLGAKGLGRIDVCELGEASAVQALAFRQALALPDEALNPDGGQLARGEAGGAAGAVLVVRLFTRLVRAEDASPAGRGVAVISAPGGQAVAALFERV